MRAGALDADEPTVSPRNPAGPAARRKVTSSKRRTSPPPVGIPRPGHEPNDWEPDPEWLAEETADERRQRELEERGEDYVREHDADSEGADEEWHDPGEDADWDDLND